MSILIKGMDMPTSCLSCDFCNPFTDEPYCRRLMRSIPKGTRLEDCPLVEVPTPHGRLKDADALKPYLLNEHYKYRLVFDADEVANAPTIIEAEGRE